MNNGQWWRTDWITQSAPNNMIQKRYQYWVREGVVWTPWADYCEDDSQLKEIEKMYKWQLKNKLKNEFRVV